tara:strand:+ start:1558 stop:1785 length:228 start_codon:yes stop_codon:yes gene_type:complete
MKSAHQKLYTWIRSMNKSELEAISITDSLFKSLLPFSKKYGFDLDTFVNGCLNDYGCTSLAKFKDIANYRIKRKG